MDGSILTLFVYSASDLQLVLLMAYALAFAFVPSLSRSSALTLHFGHALAWCLFHTVGLGLLLRAQSQSKFMVRHYLKHYHYPQNDRGQGAVQEAFQNWKAIYNLSMGMTYGMSLPTMFSMLAPTRVLQYLLSVSRGRHTLFLSTGRSETSCCATLSVL